MPDLAGYIQGGQPQVLVGDPSLAEPGGPPVAEAIDPNQPVTQAVTPIPQAVTPVPSGEPPSGADPNIGASGSPAVPDQGVTTPDPRDEAIRHLQEQLDAQALETARQAEETARLRQQQAAESARREEARVLAQIQAIPDEIERERVYNNYRHQQNQAIIQTQQAQIQAVHREKEQSAQEVARNSVVTIRALMEGIPAEYIPLLKHSETPQELEQHIQLLKGNLQQGLAQQQQQTRQEIVDSGVYAAGGAQAGFIPPQMPQERSGDLAGLIAATPPRFS